METKDWKKKYKGSVVFFRKKRLSIKTASENNKKQGLQWRIGCSLPIPGQFKLFQEDNGALSILEKSILETCDIQPTGFGKLAYRGKLSRLVIKYLGIKAKKVWAAPWGKRDQGWGDEMHSEERGENWAYCHCRGNDPTAHQVRRMKVQSVVEFQVELWK